jgi:hypothetical protein
MRLSAAFVVVALCFIALKCGGGRRLVSLQTLESRAAVTGGDITLGEYVVVPDVMACVEGTGRKKEHCFYGAVSSEHPAARALGTAEDSEDVFDAVAQSGIALLVRSESRLATALRPEHGEADGRLVRLAELPAEDQEAIAGIELKNVGHPYVFLPDAEDTVLGGLLRTSFGKKMLFTLGLLALLGVLTVIRLRLKASAPDAAAPPRVAPSGDPRMARLYGVWVNEAGIFDKVVVVTDEAVYRANPPKAELAGLLARISAGESPDIVLSKETKVVPLDQITRIRIEENDEDMEVFYGNDSLDMSFKDAVDRDKAFAALERNLKGFRFERVALNPFTAGWKPLLVTLALAFGTWIAHQASAQLAAGDTYEIHGRKRAFKKLVMQLLELIGPTGVLILGGLMVLVAAYVFAQRVRQPPTYVSLVKSS